MYVPEMEIKGIVFRTRGSNAVLNSVDYGSELKKENSRINKKYEKEDEFLKKYSKYDDKNYKGSNELPEELKLMFESMKKSMLTKNKNNWYINLLHFDIL